MRRVLQGWITGMLLATSAFAQQPQPTPKTIPESVKFIWNDIEHDFTGLAEAMPEDEWNFEPTQDEFKDVRTFREQVKHVACANEAWAKQMAGEKPPERCDIGGPNPAKTKAEILSYLRLEWSTRLSQRRTQRIYCTRMSDRTGDQTDSRR